MTVPAPAREFTPLPAAPRRALGGVAVLLASVLMASCGGGDQVKKFEPTSFVSFGDESSVLASETVGGSAEPLKGLKYTVNSLVIQPGVRNQFVPALEEGATFEPAQWNNVGGFYPTAPEQGTPEVLPNNSINGDVNNSIVRRKFTMDFVRRLKDATVDEPPLVGATVAYDYGYICNENRLWIQLLANSRSLGFSGQCGLERGGAVTHAEAGARVATDVTVGGVLRKSVKTQVAEHRSELNSGTMV
ncbi:MAG: hypothetical protein EOP40_17315, partial [Rubrivivax sp.]